MKKTVFLLFLLTFTMTTAWSQSVDAVISKYFENAGGLEKWKALKTMKLNGMFPTPQGEFAFEMSRKTPNKYIISLDIMGQKMVPQAYDGETAWMLNPFADPTPQKLPEDQAKTVKLDADFEDPFIDYARKGYVVTYEGTGDVDGIKCEMLKLVKTTGVEGENVEMVYYFDIETYLPVLVKQKSAFGPMAGQEVQVYYSDYQDAGEGIIMPFTLDTRVNGQSVQLIKFASIAVNVEIGDEVFKFPTQ